MAIVALRCASCGHEFDTITGSTIADKDTCCPRCKAPIEACERLIQGSTRRVHKRRTLEMMSSEELARVDVEEGLHSKREYEEMSEQILSGELDLDESRTIEEFRPQVPEHLRKRYY